MMRILIVVVVGLVLVSQIAFVVPMGEQALVVQLGEVVRTIRDPNVYFKFPLIQDLIRFEKRILVADARPDEYMTLDQKRLVVDTVSRWKISDPKEFYKTVKSYRGAISRLNDIISGRLRQEVASHNFKEFIRENRRAILEKVTESTIVAAKQFGIDVVDVRIKRLDLPNEVQTSVFSRMKAERERIAMRYRAEGDEKAREIKAQADKEKKIILAEAYRLAQDLRGAGDAEAAAIYADAYGKDIEFFSFVRHLDVYGKVFGPETTLLLRPDSDLTRYLESPGQKTRKPDEKK